jgi:hypothetical protein
MASVINFITSQLKYRMHMKSVFMACAYLIATGNVLVDVDICPIVNVGIELYE